MANRNLALMVKKSNILCRASWAPESVWEARLIALVASKIKTSDKDFQTYEVSITAILAGQDRGGMSYNLIEDTTKKSMSHPIKIKNEKTGGWDMYNLFSKCSYNPKKSSITVRFDPDLKPHYLQLKKHFAKYDLAQFLLLPSTYSQRLYEILKSWDDQSEVNIDIVDLHTMLDVPESLKKNFKDFRRRVLEKAHKDITKHTVLKYEWEPIKRGRKVVFIKFVFTSRRAKKASAAKDLKRQQKPQKPKKVSAKLRKRLVDEFKALMSPTYDNHSFDAILNLKSYQSFQDTKLCSS
jgi:plasmid replication initiation protein